ncbi:cytochrome P450 3A24-like [Oppia nitens]|uniref:cytochrome P450 3A24-like n=1 Tax=Oppia nitens TaxID=1686743 RepID=UPI0023DB2982|nr:cytochrome P450 3A24-like [Oppia nitens]
MLKVLILTIVVGIIVWYKWRKRLMSQLKRNGIPGPEPHILWGNFKEYQIKGYAKCHEEWIKKYGRIVGYYLGGKPFVLVADPELLKVIQIKEFHEFSKRQLLLNDSGLNPNPRFKHSLISCKDSRWKQMRSNLSPTFSGAKLKQMTPIIESTINKFLSRVADNERQRQEFDIYDLFQGLTMETIAKAGFGFDSESQTKDEDAVIEAVKAVFNVSVGQVLLFLWLVFPEFRFIINPIRILIDKVKDYFGYSDHGFLLKISDQLIKQRRANNGSNNQRDLLQLMLESEASGMLSNDKLSISSDMNDDNDIEVKEKWSKKSKMTDDEISANAVLFFEAGYETTSTALGYLMHILINKQDIQEKVRQEVKELMETEGKLDYNTVTKLKYLEQVIYETLRVYPPVTTFISRTPRNDFHYNGLTLQKGVDIRVPLYYLHRDPELWTKPEVFDENRFSDENKHLVNPVVWQPFGVGPRNCIGMRFALLEIKLTIAKLLIKYKLIESNNTELGDIQRDFKTISMTPKTGVFTKAVLISTDD